MQMQIYKGNIINEKYFNLLFAKCTALQVQRLFAEDLRADVYNTQPFSRYVFSSSRKISSSRAIISMNANVFVIYFFDVILSYFCNYPSIKKRKTIKPKHVSI